MAAGHQQRNQPVHDDLALLKGLQLNMHVARYQLHDADWQPMRLGQDALPGYHWIPLPPDSRKSWQAYWMKMDAGTRGPLHVHPSTELILVFQGDFGDQGGEKYGPGDVVVYENGSRHSTCSVHGCLVLVIARAEAVVTTESE
jgi:anti-sigma factor ChrR (cupin superfamily)